MSLHEASCVVSRHRRDGSFRGLHPRNKLTGYSASKIKFQANMKKKSSLERANTNEIYQELQLRQKVELTKQILLALASVSALTAGIILAPQLTSFVCKMLYKKTKNKQYLRSDKSITRTLRRLRQQELISWKENRQGKVTITLTDSGKKRILKYQLKDMSIKQPKRWDRKWRVVIFDIPEDHKNARDVMREKLKILGLYQLQKSVWVHPYRCKDEVDFVSHVYGVGRYLLYLETFYLENEEFLRERFSLTDKS